MKGAIFQEVGKIIIKDDIPEPKIKANEVLIKVKNCGICGTDMESFHSGTMILSGLIPGHEFSGEIVEIGESVKKWKIGDRVTANPNLTCGKCHFCEIGEENMCKTCLEGIGIAYNGAMAEYLKIRSDRLHSLPQNVSFEEGAMVEPTSIVVYAVQASQFKIGENAVIYGAGTIGLLAIQVLKAVGASEIYVIEPNEFKQKKALEVGATEVFIPKNWPKINKLTKIGPDHIYDCAGFPMTYNNALKLIRNGGLITIIGLHAHPFEMEAFMQIALKNIIMRGVYGYKQESFVTAIDLLKKKKINVDPIITKRIKIDDVPEAFKILSEPNNQEMKILIQMD